MAKQKTAAEDLTEGKVNPWLLEELYETFFVWLTSPIQFSYPIILALEGRVKQDDQVLSMFSGYHSSELDWINTSVDCQSSLNVFQIFSVRRRLISKWRSTVWVWWRREESFSQLISIYPLCSPVKKVDSSSDFTSLFLQRAIAERLGLVSWISLSLSEMR